MAEGIFIRGGSAAVVTVLLAVTFGLLSCTSGIKATEVSANSGRRTLRDWEKEQQADRVVLPEQPAVTFAQFAGMVNVDPKAGGDYFYFLVESPKHASKKPLTLWLNGGPGCSSLYGFAKEFGPYRILPDSSGVYLDDDHAWNRESNMLFLESPSGVGFSYSKNSSENEEGGDIRTAADNYLFLLNWFKRFPQYKGQEFYVASESYAGHYVLQLAKLIADSNPGAILKINLKGILAGNPVTAGDRRYWDNVGQIDNWHSHAMISDQTWEGLNAICNFSDPDCCSKACNKFYDQAWDYDFFDPYSIYTNACVYTSGTSWRARRKASLAVRSNNPFMRARRGYDPCAAHYVEVYFNRPEVQKALHANVSGIIPYEWTGCYLKQTWTDSDFSVIPLYKALIKAGLNIWLFSGDADAIVPVTSTRYAIAAMNLTVKEQWRAWYHHQQVGGRVLGYEGLTFVTIRGAGHEVPLLQPGRALHIFKAFLAAKTLPVVPYE